ncbi:MAG: division/cell wall cluster transcriptional repressor MraZ [Burkholderiales bacterium]
MFQGTSELTVDAKGRLAVPTKHRDALTSGGRGVVLTAHPDGCLMLYPYAAWEPVSAKMQSLSAFNEQARWWNRLVVGHAEELELDAQGRILVSPTLRKFASISKDVMFVGQSNRFELWDVAIWEERRTQAQALAATSPPPGTDNFTL